MGNPPISNQVNIQDLRGWMKEKGIDTLEDISQWLDGEWED